LFIELYLDEDVDALVSDLIRARGFTSITARDAGNLHKDDNEQLSYAADNRFVFVTQPL
jgi:predicted nuclease of predicted toxin-antitoxin system